MVCKAFFDSIFQHNSSDFQTFSESDFRLFSDITLTYMLNFSIFFNIFRQFVNSGYISKTVAG